MQLTVDAWWATAVLNIFTSVVSWVSEKGKDFLHFNRNLLMGLVSWESKRGVKKVFSPVKIAEKSTKCLFLWREKMHIQGKSLFQGKYTTHFFQAEHYGPTPILFRDHTLSYNNSCLMSCIFWILADLLGIKGNLIHLVFFCFFRFTKKGNFSDFLLAVHAHLI